MDYEREPGRLPTEGLSDRATMFGSDFSIGWREVGRRMKSGQFWHAGCVALTALEAESMIPSMSITAVVQNDMIKLPVHVPDGTCVEIILPAGGASVRAGNALAWLKKHAGSVEGPEDFAAEHDHYVHGTPKRAAR
jgi:hypothetical protein